MPCRGLLKKAFLFLGLALLLAILAGAGQTSILKLKVIVLRGANIRSEPDFIGAILKTVPVGTLFESPGKEGRWYKVSLPADDKGPAATGYIYDSLVVIVEEIKIRPTKVEAPPRPRKEEPAVEKVEPVEKRLPQPEVAPRARQKDFFCFRLLLYSSSVTHPPSLTT